MSCIFNVSFFAEPFSMNMYIMHESDRDSTEFFFSNINADSLKS